MASEGVGLSVARCEGCGLGYELDDLRCRAGHQLGDCLECGSPVYVIDLAEAPNLADMIEGCGACVAAGAECDFHTAVGVGWDACVAWMAREVERQRRAELVGGDLPALAEGAG